jgi:hypothetical protein
LDVSPVWRYISGELIRIRLGVEKTVSRAERAWFLSYWERRARPESERDFLAGEILRVFDALCLIHNPSCFNGKKRWRMKRGDTGENQCIVRRRRESSVSILI